MFVETPRAVNFSVDAVPPYTLPMSLDMMFLSTEVCLEKCRLLHGTCASALAGIAKQGLLPRRQRKARSQWAANPSHPDAVYLTTAYALHYAANALTSGFAAILEIDASALDMDNLVADEDSYAMTSVQGHAGMEAWPLERKTGFWRDRLEDTDANASLRVLGNCAHLGPIPPSVIAGVRLLSRDEMAKCIFGISDPAIIPLSFKVHGGLAQRFYAWLMMHQLEESEYGEWFQEVCSPALPVMTLAEAGRYIQTAA
jgi:hypothetical protein